MVLVMHITNQSNVFTPNANRTESTQSEKSFLGAHQETKKLTLLESNVSIKSSKCPFWSNAIQLGFVKEQINFFNGLDKAKNGSSNPDVKVRIEKFETQAKELLEKTTDKIETLKTLMDLMPKVIAGEIYNIKTSLEGINPSTTYSTAPASKPKPDEVSLSEENKKIIENTLKEMTKESLNFVKEKTRGYIDSPGAKTEDQIDTLVTELSESCFKEMGSVSHFLTGDEYLDGIMTKCIKNLSTEIESTGGILKARHEVDIEKINKEVKDLTLKALNVFDQSLEDSNNSLVQFQYLHDQTINDFRKALKDKQIPEIYWEYCEYELISSLRDRHDEIKKD